MPKKYIIADSSDNSVTLSEKLFKHICKHSEGKPKVFVYKVGDTFAFSVDPEQLKDTNTQMADIQYNKKHKTIGFETLCPSVNYMVYSFGLPPLKRIKLKVNVCKTKQGMLFYKIKRPNAKRFRDIKKA